MDAQITISAIAVAVAGFGLYYDYKFPYPASSSVSDAILQISFDFSGLCRLLHHLLCPYFDLATLYDVSY
jgi:hypothetical protein